MSSSRQDEATVTGAHLSSSLLVLSAPVVDAILADVSIDELARNQSDVFRTFSSASVSSDTDDNNAAVSAWQSPLRTSVTTSLHTHLFMPSRNVEQTTIKCVAVPRPDVSTTSVPPGLPAIGLTFHSHTGQLDVLLNAAQLTAVRTAAGCLAASIAMQPTLSATTTTTLVVFGTGNQARWHARLFVEQYKLKHVYFITTNIAAKGESVAYHMRSQLHLDDVQVYAQGSDSMYYALQRADFVCGCTPSRSPLFAWDRCESWKEGVHFSLIGSYKKDMQEVPVQVVQQAAQNDALAVDSIEACKHEAGDLLQAHVDPTRWREIGRIIAARDPTFDTSNRMSMFKSVGFALQDTAIFTLVVEQARKRGVGEWVAFH